MGNRVIAFPGNYCVNHCSYVTRIMYHAPDIRRNIEALRQYLTDQGEEGRRAEMFSTVYAAAHFVTSAEDLTPHNMQECAAMASGRLCPCAG